MKLPKRVENHYNCGECDCSHHYYDDAFECCNKRTTINTGEKMKEHLYKIGSAKCIKCGQDATKKGIKKKCTEIIKDNPEDYCGHERPPRKVLCQLKHPHTGSHRAIIYWED